MKLWWDGEWHYSTNGMIDAFEGDGAVYGKLFKKIRIRTSTRIGGYAKKYSKSKRSYKTKNCLRTKRGIKSWVIFVHVLNIIKEKLKKQKIENALKLTLNLILVKNNSITINIK